MKKRTSGRLNIFSVITAAHKNLMHLTEDDELIIDIFLFFKLILLDERHGITTWNEEFNHKRKLFLPKESGICLRKFGRRSFVS